MGLKDGDLKSSEEAAMWLQRLRERDTPELHAEFSEWIRKGASNLEEFLFAQAIWKEMDHIDGEMRERLWSAESPESVIDFPKREASRLDSERLEYAGRGRRPWFAVTAATLSVLALGWALLSLVGLGSTAYTTDVGEQKSVKLSDGSLMHINTTSRVVVQMTDDERTIRLVSGEALFTVAPDARRPFYVLTDSARVRALGTKFNVYRNNAMETRVAVVDGSVQVSSLTETQDAYPRKAETIQLKAGDEAGVDRGRVVKAKTPNVERAVSWRVRKLMFPGNQVGEIVEEFNRYNKTSIRLEGEDLKARRMSGVFDADDPSPLLRYLEREPRIEVIRNTDEIVVRLRGSED